MVWWWLRMLPVAAGLGLGLWLRPLLAQETGPAASVVSGGQEGVREGRSEDPGSYSGPLELLQDLRVHASLFDRVVDDAPLDTGDHELLVRMLNAAGQFGPRHLYRWGRQNWRPDAVQADPRSARGLLWTVTGRVTAIEAHSLLPELADRFEFQDYYRCQVELAGPAGGTAQVFVRELPTRWYEHLATGHPINERCQAYGFFIKRIGPDQAAFVAPRIAWRDSSLLGQLGMDRSRFDTVRHRARLRYDERECFYELLDVVGNVDPLVLEQETKHFRLDPGKLLNRPEQYIGVPMAVEGTARRATRILVDDPDVQERFRLKYYYEIEVLVDFGVLVKVGDVTLRYYPVTYCARQVPAGMPIGDRITEQVRVTGFLMKLWRYDSGVEDASGKRGPRVAPLLIGYGPIWTPSDSSPRRNPVLQLLAGCLFSATVAGLWAVMWYIGRRDTDCEKLTRELRFPLSAGPGQALAAYVPVLEHDFQGLDHREPAPPPSAEEVPARLATIDVPDEPQYAIPPDLAEPAPPPESPDFDALDRTG